MICFVNIKLEANRRVRAQQFFQLSKFPEPYFKIKYMIMIFCSYIKINIKGFNNIVNLWMNELKFLTAKGYFLIEWRFCIDWKKCLELWVLFNKVIFWPFFLVDSFSLFFAESSKVKRNWSHNPLSFPLLSTNVFKCFTRTLGTSINHVDIWGKREGLAKWPFYYISLI